MWNYLLEPDIFRSFHWWRRDEENRAQKRRFLHFYFILFYLNECRQCAFNSIYIKLMDEFNLYFFGSVQINDVNLNPYVCTVLADARQWNSFYLSSLEFIMKTMQ